MRSRDVARGLSVAFLVMLGASAHAAELQPSSIWMTDFAKAQAEAARLNRPLVVHFHTPWCRPCRQMERDVLHTPAVLKRLNEGFVAVKVDLDKPENGKYQAKYHVDSMPVDLMLSPEGKELHRSKGYDPNLGDREKYTAALTRIDAKYTKNVPNIARSNASGSASTPEKKEKLPRTTPSKPAISVAAADSS